MLKNTYYMPVFYDSFEAKFNFQINDIESGYMWSTYETREYWEIRTEQSSYKIDVESNE